MMLWVMTCTCSAEMVTRETLERSQGSELGGLKVLPETGDGAPPSSKAPPYPDISMSARAFGFSALADLPAQIVAVATGSKSTRTTGADIPPAPKPAAVPVTSAPIPIPPAPQQPSPQAPPRPELQPLLVSPPVSTSAVPPAAFDPTEQEDSADATQHHGQCGNTPEGSDSAEEGSSTEASSASEGSSTYSKSSSYDGNAAGTLAKGIANTVASSFPGNLGNLGASIGQIVAGAEGLGHVG
ncbi:uncharacterized protein L969DRAFT_94048 [Mixia osmundae IAM 14324]|uniref:Uncharacterized protein n=1 Tax=Mixia osmundae (strain CBS 9802 / IAM 14324 / JCM 22182 / KY 12970) TaxID=764103 RepID=G7E8X8_MIXOS|nr:uncharacterized protein L969DRAFT_94048 [Mixia osmundae IAM 14324]KEI40230.1 hypothetical protein L969DRAFT_94048 [Mixia osmundae IAM 14324]GAA99596.1 hypothetical protein E5Q_06297 [Mixia osmundae IAM 14324]